MKKLLLLFSVAALMVSLASCGAEKGPDTEHPESATINDVINNEGASTVELTEEAEENSTDEPQSGEETTDESLSEEESSEKEDKDKLPADPSKWTKKQIVEYYKDAMAETDKLDGIQTGHHFGLKEKLPGGAAILSGPVNKALDLASKPFDGLTGGYEDLTEDDLVSASARKEGDYVIINMTPKNQVDGTKGKKHEGPVGHVVDVFEGIDSLINYIEDNFSILNAKYEDDSIVFTYTNPYAKDIKINTKTGRMESGKWGYILDLWLDHCSLMGVKFNDFHCYITYDAWYPA